MEKAAYISEHPVAMRRLRVCLARDTDYNCGRCEKCLRTIINLHVAGASGKCETLPEEPDLEAVASMDLGGESARAFALENLMALQRMGNEPGLAYALETALERNFEGEGVRRQLAVARAELAKIKRRLPGLAATHKRLRAPQEPLFQPPLPGRKRPGQRPPQGARVRAAAGRAQDRRGHRSKTDRTTPLGLDGPSAVSCRPTNLPSSFAQRRDLRHEDSLLRPEPDDDPAAPGLDDLPHPELGVPDPLPGAVSL